MRVHFKFPERRKYLKHKKESDKVLAAALQMMITSSVHSSGSPALENLLSVMMQEYTDIWEPHQ